MGDGAEIADQLAAWAAAGVQRRTELLSSPPDAALVNGSSPGGRAPAAGNCTDRFPGLVE